MGKQVVFYANNHDTKELLSFCELEGLVGIFAVIPTDQIAQTFLPTQLIEYLKTDLVYLMPKEINPVEALYEEFHDDATQSGIDYTNSPVFEFTPSRLEAQLIFDGRIYFDLNPEDQFYAKTHKKYNKIASYIKKWKKTDQFGFYVGPDTAKQAKSGLIELWHHLIKLNVAD